MSLAEILRGIEDESRREAEGTVAAARQQAERLVEAAEAAAQVRIEEAVTAAEPAVRAEAVRIVNAARLRLLHGRAEHTASLCDAAWSEARRHLEALASQRGRRWAAGLRRLTTEALEMTGDGATVAVRAADRRLVAALVAEHGGTLEALADDAPAGPRARSPDGRLEVDATLPARLARARVALAGEVAAWVGADGAGGGRVA